MGYTDISSFAEIVTREQNICLLKKSNIQNQNYDDDENCLHKNVTKFSDFV